jgi:hypothetical protein
VLVKLDSTRFSQLFGSRLLEIFSETFLKNTDPNVKRTMIRMFNSWKGYFDHYSVLKPIEDRLKIKHFEKELFIEADPNQLNEYYDQKSTHYVDKDDVNNEIAYSHLVQQPALFKGFPSHSDRYINNSNVYKFSSVNDDNFLASNSNSNNALYSKDFENMFYTDSFQNLGS